MNNSSLKELRMSGKGLAEWWRNVSSDQVRACLAAGYNPRTQGRGHIEALHVAARYCRDPDIIDALVEGGADVNVATRGEKDFPRGKDRPLGLALSENENPRVIEALLRHGAVVKTPPGPYHHVIQNNNPEVIKVLSDSGPADELGINVHADGGTPLTLALRQKKSPVMIEALLMAGADANLAEGPEFSPSNLPLHLAIEQGNPPDTIELLLRHGADPDVLDSGGRACLHKVRSPEMVDVLVAGGADIHLRSEGSLVPLHFFAWGSRVRPPAVGEALIRHGADINAVADGGETALHFATLRGGDPDSIRILLDAGADITIRNAEGWTPLDVLSKDRDYPEELIHRLSDGVDVAQMAP